MLNTRKNIEKKRIEIIKSFSIHDFIITNNPLKKHLNITSVEFDKAASSVNSKSIQYYITDKLGRQRFLLYDLNKVDTTTGEPVQINSKKGFYINNGIASDKGDFFQFIRNRTKNKTYSEVFELLDKFDFHNNVDAWKKNLDPSINTRYLEKQSSSQSTKKFNLEDFKNLRNATIDVEKNKDIFLHKRGITNETLLDPLFENQIMLYEYTDNYGNIETYALFPKRQNNIIVGAEVKPLKGKGYCFGQENILWKSNKPEVVKKIIVTESALNSISHRQENKDNEHTWYFSTNGNFYKERIENLFKELEKNNIDIYNCPITLATDNDFDGLTYDARLLSYFLKKDENIIFNDSINGKRSVSCSIKDPRERGEIHKYFIKLANKNHNCTIVGDAKKLHFVYNDKSFFKNKPLFIKDLIDSTFLKDLPIAFEKSTKWSDWNDFVQYKFDKSRFEKITNITNLYSPEKPHPLIPFGIDADILEDKSFRDRVYVFNHKTNHNTIEKAFYFPKIKNGHEFGAEIHLGNKIEHAHKNKDLCWHSNVPKKTDFIVIVEDVKEAISHKKIDMLTNDNTLYISIGKRYNKNIRDNIFQILKDENLDISKVPLKIELNNNINSLKMEFLILNKYLKNGVFWVSYNKEEKTYGINFKSDDNLKFEEMKKCLSDIKNHLMKSYSNYENALLKLITTNNTILLEFPNEEKLKNIVKDFSTYILKKTTLFNDKKLVLFRKNRPSFNNSLRSSLGIKINNSQKIEKKKYRHKIKS